MKKQLHNDPWMMARIAKALDAIRYADREGLETELDLLAFAEDVLARPNAMGESLEQEREVLRAMFAEGYQAAADHYEGPSMKRTSPIVSELDLTLWSKREEEARKAFDVWLDAQVAEFDTSATRGNPATPDA